MRLCVFSRFCSRAALDGVGSLSCWARVEVIMILCRTSSSDVNHFCPFSSSPRDGAPPPPPNTTTTTTTSCPNRADCVRESRRSEAPRSRPAAGDDDQADKGLGRNSIFQVASIDATHVVESARPSLVESRPLCADKRRRRRRRQRQRQTETDD